MRKKKGQREREEMRNRCIYYVVGTIYSVVYIERTGVRDWA